MHLVNNNPVIYLPREQWTCGPAPVHAPHCQPSDFDLMFDVGQPPYSRCLGTCPGGRARIMVYSLDMHADPDLLPVGRGADAS